jgi:hypothetical protein
MSEGAGVGIETMCSSVPAQSLTRGDRHSCRLDKDGGTSGEGLGYGTPWMGEVDRQRTLGEVWEGRFLLGPGVLIHDPLVATRAPTE